MKTLINMFSKSFLFGFLAIAIFGGTSYSIHLATQEVDASTFRVVQTPKTSLYSGMSAAATSMRITPYPKDLAGVKLTITDFGDNPTLTISPGLKDYEEIVRFSAIVDNGDNTATLTLTGRGMSSKYPYTSTGTGIAHGATSFVVFGNNPQVYGRLAAKENAETITGSWMFSSSSLPYLDHNPGASTWTGLASTTFVTLGKLADTALASAIPATESAVGYVELATAAEQASSTITGSTGASLVKQARYATDTPQAKCNSLGSANGAGCSVVAGLAGKIVQTFINLTEAYAWSGRHTFSGELLVSGTSSATSSKAVFGFGDMAQLLASTTITGNTTPQPVFISTTTNALLLSDANDNMASQFVGFAVTNGTNGATSTIQMNGVVQGFSGLTRGAVYFVQDAVGTIGTSAGTNEIRVGIAISATELSIDRDSNWVYVGSGTCSLTTGNCDIAGPSIARFARVERTAGNAAACSGPRSGSITITQTVFKNGNSTANDHAAYVCGDTVGSQSGAGAYFVVNFTSTSSVRLTQTLTGSGANSGGTQTAYFYR